MERCGIATIADLAERKMTMHERHKVWIEGRGIDPVLAEKMGLETVMRDGARWLAVPYYHGGEVINHKYRLTSEKRHMMDSGAPLSLWNADCLADPKVQQHKAPVIVTEGEWDAIAAIQAGFQFTVSVPNGAPSSETADLDTAKRYDWVERHMDMLKNVHEFIIATDDDPAGHYLRADLIALFGAERCRFIEYPFPCKDLNEVLTEYGEQRLVECINTARPCPVKGLYTIDDFPERGEVRSYSIGVKPIADMISIVPGTLTVVTGYANMGKSTLMNAIIGHALRYHFPVCVASFETEVKPILVNGLRCAIMQCAMSDLGSVDTSDADDILRNRLRIISQIVDEDAEMTLEDFLEYCRIAVVRDGVKMIVLDPWNEIEHKRRRDETETDYIGRALRAIKAFARRYDVAFWIVAHPTKPQEGSSKVPGLYDISGSANWANKPEYGLTYHRPDPSANHAVIRTTKVRMGLPGQKASRDVTFDFRTSEFATVDGT
jgi:twinkle protein